MLRGPREKEDVSCCVLLYVSEGRERMHRASERERRRQKRRVVARERLTTRARAHNKRDCRARNLLSKATYCTTASSTNVSDARSFGELEVEAMLESCYGVAWPYKILRIRSGRELVGRRVPRKCNFLADWERFRMDIPLL